MTIRKNLTLILGLAIPVLMILFVAGSIYLPALFAPEPKYDFLYMTDNGYDYYSRDQYSVVSGQLTVGQPQYPEGYVKTISSPRFFVLDVVRNKTREVTLAEAQTLKLDSNQKSEDDFEVVYGNAGGGGFLFDFGGRDYNSVYLRGHSSSKKLNVQLNGNYYGFRFLGWIQ